MMIVKKIVVRGRVQGIGYRPFVAEMAEKLNICGWVRNISGIVEIQASGEDTAIIAFEKALKDDAPVGSLVLSVESEALDIMDLSEGFKIISSDRDNTDNNKRLPLIPADLPTCDRCNSELHDSSNRRYKHPFISCTACGPRYSIINAIPYDRESITMNRFGMCEACEQEYTGKGNIRRHAQTIACPNCGPKLRLDEVSGAGLDSLYTATGNEESLIKAIEILKAGGIIAVKDIGGFHLVASPFIKATVSELRAIKGRESKPFAVCFNNTRSIKAYCHVSKDEEELLTLDARPIVLLRARRDGKHLASNVCTTSPDIGAMLPCNPVQIMLTEALGPLIMTSANISGELMTIENDKMLKWMKEAAKQRGDSPNKVRLGVLSHDRPIITPLDDSILRIVNGKRQTLRRARGFVPEPISFPYDRQVFAAGGDLKACFCHTGDKKAYLSQHFGDLYEESCFMEYEKEIIRMKSIFGFNPEENICDMHPAYKSSSNAATDRRVQHHRAHVASVIAEHNLTGPVLGFAFDGTGYGDDGSIWGSEVFSGRGDTSSVLISDGELCPQFSRIAHLAPVNLIGGDEGARNADTILYGYLHNISHDNYANNQNQALVAKAIDMGINTVKSTSMGRLFDAVSAFLDICHYNSYEGEAPIELENLATTTDKAYPLSFGIEQGEDGCLWILPEPLFAGMMQALEAGVNKAEIARGFIYAVANVIVDIARKKADRNTAIALSGGNFLNKILLERVTFLLEENGYNVYRNEQVPPGDGGLCLGQAYLACIDEI